MLLRRFEGCLCLGIDCALLGEVALGFRDVGAELAVGGFCTLVSREEGPKRGGFTRFNIRRSYKYKSVCEGGSDVLSFEV